jgi:hypothetical protein
MVKLIDFNPDTSDQLLIKAIDYYRAVDGDIQANAPIDFLTEQEKQVVFNEGSTQYADFETVMKELRTALHEKYQQVNQRFLSGENAHLTIDDTIKINTPKIDNDDMGYIASLLNQNGYVPILRILADVNRTTDFIDSFKHFSHKHKKMKPCPKPSALVFLVRDVILA